MSREEEPKEAPRSAIDQAVRHAMQVARPTAADFAEALGVSVSTLEAYRRGVLTMPPDTCRLFAAILRRRGRAVQAAADALDAAANAAEPL